MELLSEKTITNQQLFTQYYLECFPKVATLVKRSGGSLDDARDIFQDAIVILYERTGQSAVGEIKDDMKYLYGISKNLLSKQLEQKKTRPTTNIDERFANPSTESQSTPIENILQHLESAGQKCLELLKAFYYDRLDMKDIATRFGFSGERSATVQKHKCLTRVRSEIQNKFLKREDFYE